MINPGSPPGASPTQSVPGPRFFKAMDVNLCSDRITVHLLSVLQCFPRIAAAIRRFTYLLLSLSDKEHREPYKLHNRHYVSKEMWAGEDV